MLKKFVLSGIVFLLLFTMGCTLQNPGSDPIYSVLPEVLLDYDLETMDTNIWIKSAISDFKYHYIKIEIFHENDIETTEQNNTYCVYTSISYQTFNMTVNVFSETKQFQYQSSISIDFIDEELSITVYDLVEDESKIYTEENLPYKKVLKELR